MVWVNFAQKKKHTTIVMKKMVSNKKEGKTTTLFFIGIGKLAQRQVGKASPRSISS